MAIGEYEELAFRLITLFHFYMWPLPVKIDYEKSKLVLNKPAIKYIPFTLILMFIWLFGWTCLASTIFFGFISPRENFAKVNTAIFLLVWAAFSSLCVTVYYSFLHIDAVVSSFNEVLEIADEIDEEYRDGQSRWRVESKQVDVSIVLPLIVPVGSMAPFAIAIAAQYADFDCPYFILEEVLPDAKYRSGNTIGLIFIIRILVTYVSALETCRSIMFGACCVLIAIDRGNRVMKSILGKVRDFHGFYNYYRCCILLIKKTEKVLNVGLYMFMTIGFWGLVASCWVSVKYTVEQISLPVYLSFITVVGLLIGAHAVALPILCSALTMAECVVQVHSLRAEFQYAKKRTTHHKMLLMKVRATAPIRIKYGPFWCLGKKFLGEYLWLIVLRTFDAILVIH